MAEHSLTTSGATVVVAVGDAVEITAPELGGAGYVWEVTHCPAGVELTDSTLALPSRAPGAGGQRTMRFMVTAPLAGPADLQLALRRPWETGVEPHAVFDVRLMAA